MGGTTSLEDVVAIKAIFDTDPYLNSLGYGGSNVLTYGKPDEEFEQGDKNIMIRLGTGEERVGHYVGVVFGIDVSANTSERGTVLKACSQIQALLHERDIGNNHELTILSSPREISSIGKGVYVVTMTFMAYELVWNEIKTV